MYVGSLAVWIAVSRVLERQIAPPTHRFIVEFHLAHPDEVFGRERSAELLQQAALG
jgi:hypothetical protein